MIEPKRSEDQGKHRLSHYGKRFFKLIEFDENEELLLEIRKHAFGMYVIVVSGATIALAVILVTFILADSSFLTEISADGVRPFIALTGFILAVIILIATVIYIQLYRSDVVYITNEKVAQVLYKTLFHRSVSQLSIGDVQDVNVSQRGIFAHMFGYGTLVIETAGEQQNYTFNFVPNPHESAKVIIQAHEVNLRLYGN